MKNKAVFLDRDGTINVDHGYVYKTEDFQFIDGAAEAMKMLKDAGYLLIIVTNQSGIARGYYTEEDFMVLHRAVEEMLQKEGVSVDGLYYCPHLENCDCRKPQLKLFYDAARDFSIDFSQSYAVGDRMRDLAICEAEGVKGFLISDTEEKHENITVCRSLLQAAESITGR